MTSASRIAAREPPTAVVRTNLWFLVPTCVVTMLGGFLFGYDTGIISGAIEPLTAKFALSSFMKGWVSGCVLVGCAAGVLLVGLISDRFGRRLAMFLAAIMFLASAVGTTFPHSIQAFILFRLIGGVGIGIASISTPMYIAEIVPAHLRGRMISGNQIMIAGGIAATAFINYLIAHSQGSPAAPEVQHWLTESGWRWMFATGIVPSVLFGLLLFLVPESPRWLVEMKHDEKARGIMARIGGDQFAATELAGIKAALDKAKGSWAELGSARLRLPLLVGIALAVLQQITGINVFMYFGATIFKNMSASTGVDAGLLQQIVINGTCMLFTVVAIFTVDRWGRRPLLFVGASGMAASLVGMGVMAQSLADPAAAGGRMLFLIVLYIGCFGLSVGPVTWVILSEIFPTEVRGRALGMAAFFLWLADYAVTQTFPLMDANDSWFVRHFHHAFPFYGYAACCVLLVALVWKYVPETKNRSLEEIEHAWKRRPRHQPLEGGAAGS
jgi:sugar porter (SP) family MFS transporter